MILRCRLSGLKRLCLMIQALLLGAAPAAMIIVMVRSTNAAELTSRSVKIESSLPSALTWHLFSFQLGSSGVVGSIEFEYCINSPFVGTPCTAPAGLSAIGAGLDSESGMTGFNIHSNSTSNKLILSRTPAFTAAQPVAYTFRDLQNPSTPSQTVFVRISTFASDDASGSRTDSGAVAFSTTRLFNVGGYVPPYLTFCVGVNVAADCSSATGSILNLGELSKTAANTATSQFAGATNDPSGYVVSLTGSTMTSGNNIINPIASPGPSVPGTSQFGINLRQNSVPAVGQNPLGAGTVTPSSDYDTPNQFVFNNGTIASSPLPTEFNTLTVSYLVNVGGSQVPGIYSTTLTYIATANF